jgi:hypothetical protein
VEDLGAHAQAFGEGLGAAGDDHEFLDIDGGVGVGAAVDDVHHRDGQDVGVEAAEVAVEGDFEGVGGGAGDGHGDAEHGVGAELGLGFGAVEGEQASSTAFWSRASMPASALAMGPLTFLTALRTPLPR